MSDLNEHWEPSFGTIYTWFAMDKNGLIAVVLSALRTLVFLAKN